MPKRFAVVIISILIVHASAITPDRLSAKVAAGLECSAAGPVGWVFEAALAGSIAGEVECDPAECHAVENYRDVYEPPAVQAPAFALDNLRTSFTGPVTNETVGLLHHAAEAELQITAYERAVFETANRVAAARARKDKEAEARQLAYQKQLARKTADFKKAGNVALNRLLGHLKSRHIRVKTRPLTEIVRMIRDRGLPEEEVRILKDLGFSDREIDLARQKLVQVSVKTAPPTFEAAMAQMVRINLDNSDIDNCRCQEAQ